MTLLAYAILRQSSRHDCIVVSLRDTSITSNDKGAAFASCRRRRHYRVCVIRFRHPTARGKAWLSRCTWQINLIGFNFEDTYGTVFESVRVLSLCLRSCHFEEETMAGLVSAIQNSTAPRRLIIRGGNFFSKKELWNPFLQAVGSSSVSPTSLALFVSFTRWAHLGFFPALIAALGRNTVIERLLVTFDMVHLWPDIVLSLSTHPRLRSLDLCFVCDGYDVEFPVDQVAQLLRENENIEKVRFRATMYDRHEWEMIIIPLLKCNKFRKIQTLTATEQRPGRNWNALLAQAIISMKSRPTLLWMLISQNQGSIVTSISQD